MERIPELYRIYSDNKNKNSMFPSMVDGLLPVQRRILLTLHLVARNSFVKTAAVVGENMARFHPHAGAEGTCAWAVQNGFAEGSGAWGSDLGTMEIEPASMRYTKIKASPRVEDIALKYIKSVEFVESEVDPEPKYFPTMIPLCFISRRHFSYIGSGFRTDIPTFSVRDIIKRLMYAIGKTKKEPIIRPFIKNCEILSPESDIKNILINGTGVLKIKGKFTEDRKNGIIYVNSWSPEIKFETVLRKIDKFHGLIESGVVGYIDESNKKNGTKVRFEILKQRNTAGVYDKLLESIEDALAANITFRINVVTPEGDVKISPIDDMLRAAHENYTKYFKIHHENLLTQYGNIIDEYDTINKIKPHIQDCYGKKTYDLMVEHLAKTSGVKKERVSGIIEKYRIKKLLTSDFDKTDVVKSIKTVESILKTAETHIIEDYKTLWENEK